MGKEDNEILEGSGGVGRKERQELNGAFDVTGDRLIVGESKTRSF